MPGTSMGNKAKLNDPDTVKIHFFEKIGTEIGRVLNEEVDVVIEKDKKVTTGSIHTDMFKEALNTDVYIADLTGNNPNVYLELGVRWALRDKVTILVTQNVGEIRYNVLSSRVFEYNPSLGEIDNAIAEVVSAIKDGLEKKDHCDSPVRLNSELIQISKQELNNLKGEIEALKKNQGEEFIAAAKETNESSIKIDLLKKAIDVNPISPQGYMLLGIEYRNIQKYDDSINILKKGLSINSNASLLHGELGISLGKNNKISEAKESLAKAVELDSVNPELLRNFGGALRRFALINSPQKIDWKTLNDAKDNYQESCKYEPNDTYGLLNVAKLQLMLSQKDQSLYEIAEKNLIKCRHLSNASLVDKPNDYWKQFDLADTYILTGNSTDALREFEKGVNMIEGKSKKDTITTVLKSLKELVEVGVGDNNVHEIINKIIEKYQ